MEQPHRPRPSTDGIIGPARKRQVHHAPRPVNDMVASPRPASRHLDLTHQAPVSQKPMQRPTTRTNHLDLRPEPLPHLRPRPYTPIRPVQPQQVEQPEHKVKPEHHEEAAPVPQEEATVTPEPQAKQKKSFRDNKILQYCLIVIAASAVGSVLPNIQYGQWAIAAYAVFALIFRVKSQITFTLALFALVVVPILILIGQKELAENYAVYSFLLLVIGVISATIELRFSKPDNSKTLSTEH